MTVLMIKITACTMMDLATAILLKSHLLFLIFFSLVKKLAKTSTSLNGMVIRRKRKYRHGGNILKRYNFTVEENTPFDKDVSLDPELLGKVFENLLASFNPETQTTARNKPVRFILHVKSFNTWWTKV